MEAAALIAIAFTQGGSKPADYHDFFGILVVLIINSTISFIEENNAGNVAAALMARLAPKAKSALTGESLPVTKTPGDGVYSGSTCKQGEIEVVVIATGVHTFFGKADRTRPEFRPQTRSRSCGGPTSSQCQAHG